MGFDVSPVLGIFYRLTGILIFSFLVSLLAAYFSRRLGKRRQHAIMQLSFTVTLLLGVFLYVF